MLTYQIINPLSSKNFLDTLLGLGLRFVNTRYGGKPHHAGLSAVLKKSACVYKICYFEGRFSTRRICFGA
jgi:hypothetical protein